MVVLSSSTPPWGLGWLNCSATQCSRLNLPFCDVVLMALSSFDYMNNMAEVKPPMLIDGTLMELSLGVITEMQVPKAILFWLDDDP